MESSNPEYYRLVSQLLVPPIGLGIEAGAFFTCGNERGRLGENRARFPFPVAAKPRK
jgi:hypothetical protein